jgi:hypothetical protein
MTCCNDATMLHLAATACYWALDIFCQREWGVGRDVINPCLLSFEFTHLRSRVTPPRFCLKPKPPLPLARGGVGGGVKRL